MTRHHDKLKALARLVANDVHSNLCAYTSSEPRHSKACVDAAYVVALLDAEEESADADEGRECLRRLSAMATDEGETWDLSENDKNAIAWVVGEHQALTYENDQLRRERDELRAKVGESEIGLLAEEDNTNDTITLLEEARAQLSQAKATIEVLEADCHDGSCSACVKCCEQAEKQRDEAVRLLEAVCAGRGDYEMNEGFALAEAFLATLDAAKRDGGGS